MEEAREYQVRDDEMHLHTYSGFGVVNVFFLEHCGAIFSFILNAEPLTRPAETIHLLSNWLLELKGVTGHTH